MNKLAVVYSTDKNYCMHLGISIVSLLENNTEFDDIEIYVIEREIGSNNKKILFNIVNKYNRKILFIKFSDVESRIKLNLSSSKPRSIYARLFISNLIPERIEKVLYLDCDTIINKSLCKVWNTDIENYYVAGVQDIVSNKYKSIIGMKENDKYINSGVLLINLKKWRMMDIEERFLDFIELYKGEVPHHDQGVINGVCKGNIFILDPQYNVNTNCYLFNNDEIKDIYKIKNYYEKDKVEYGKNNPTILHFTPGFMNRPWVKGCKHPKRELYLKYKRETCWKNIGLEEDKRNWKIKLLSNLYYILPRKVFNTIYKLI